MRFANSALLPFRYHGTETIVARHRMLSSNTKEAIAKFFFKCTNRCEESKELSRLRILAYLIFRCRAPLPRPNRVYDFRLRSHHRLNCHPERSSRRRHDAQSKDPSSRSEPHHGDGFPSPSLSFPCANRFTANSGTTSANAPSIASNLTLGYTKSLWMRLFAQPFWNCGRLCAASSTIISTSSIEDHIRNFYAETHFSTQPPPSQQGPRIPGPYGHQGRRRRPQPPPRQGPPQDRRLCRLPRLVFRLTRFLTAALTGFRPLSAFARLNRCEIRDARYKNTRCEGFFRDAPRGATPSICHSPLATRISSPSPTCRLPGRL